MNQHNFIYYMKTNGYDVHQEPHGRTIAKFDDRIIVCHDSTQGDLMTITIPDTDSAYGDTYVINNKLTLYCINWKIHSTYQSDVEGTLDALRILCIKTLTKY